MSTQVQIPPEWSQSLGSDDPWPVPPLPELARQIDQRIRERVGNRLSDLKVEIVDDGIVLSGRCHTYYTKQLAQHAAQGVMEDQPLQNAIEVVIGG